MISDVHGRVEQLNEVLAASGLFDNHGYKRDATQIIQIGDLANCVKDSIEGDRDCLSFVGREIDFMLVGNHEIGYFDTQNRFSGFYYSADIDAQLRELNGRGLIKAAHSVNNTLITHAGLTGQQQPVMRANAVEMANTLNMLWAEKLYQHRLFSDCGRARYGRNEIGGVLWCDFDKEFKPTEFPQVVGHTVGELRMKGNAICIDAGKPTILKVS